MSNVFGASRRLLGNPVWVILTPAEEGRQAPAGGVEPGEGHDAQGLPARHGPQGGQGPGDHHVAVHGDHRQRHHAADAEQGPAEGVQLAACRGADSAPLCQQLETRRWPPCFWPRFALRKDPELLTSGQIRESASGDEAEEDKPAVSSSGYHSNVQVGVSGSYSC